MRSPSTVADQEIANFRRKILRFYERHGRDLPWRATTDPYKITVAELMLQQTQVARVMPKYQEWVERWPNFHALAEATNEELLRAWSGLGYNRRALYLGKLAKELVSRHAGKLPMQPEQLEQLPGIGPYSSRAILVFAFNCPVATVDTNIRRVLIHSFQLSPGLSGKVLFEFAERLVPKQRSRDWHNALMDYSSLMLPKQMANLPPLSRQSRFEGSQRQVRGEIVRRLLRRQPLSIRSLCLALGRESKVVEAIATQMEKEGIVTYQNGSLRLA